MRMNIGSSGNRDEWEFEYTANKLAAGAKAQHAYRLSRIEAWKAEKAKIISEIKEGGLEISESVAEKMVASSASNNYNATRGLHGPQVLVRDDLQRKLTECHMKIQEHQQTADEYEGWIQVLSANPEQRLKLTQADWLYFFQKTNPKDLENV